MKNLVLISDHNYQDIYASILKYYITSSIPDVHIFEYFVPNDIRRLYNVAAYLLMNEHHFSKNNIFYIETNISDYIPQQKIILIQYHDKWIFSPDSGLTGLIDNNKIQNIFHWKDPIQTSFYSKNEMMDALKSFVLSNFSINENFIPVTIDKCKQLTWPTIIERTSQEGIIQLFVPILYIDSYGNIILNIKQSDIQKYQNDYTIQIRVPFHTIAEIDTTYNAKNKHEVMALFNDAGYLEILVNNGDFLNLIIPKELYTADNLPTITITLNPKK